MTKPDTRPAEEYFLLFHHTYDIRAAELLIAGNSKPTMAMLDVAEIAKVYCLDRTPAELQEQGVIPLFGRVDEEYALAHADLSRPVIIGDTSNTFLDMPTEHMLIDGYHRLRRAAAEGQERLHAYVLTAQECWDIRVDSEKRRRGKRSPKPLD